MKTKTWCPETGQYVEVDDRARLKMWPKRKVEW